MNKSIKLIVKPKFLNRAELYMSGGILLGMAIFLKLFYREAETDDLLWLLQPTAWLVELLTDFSLVYQADLGFVNQANRFVITKSCAGLNFLVIAILMSGLMFIHYFRGWTNQLIVSVLFILLAYTLTIIVNSCRIIHIILLQDYWDAQTGFTHAINHLIQGVFVDFSFLIAYFALLQYIIPKYFNQNEKIA